MRYLIRLLLLVVCTLALPVFANDDSHAVLVTASDTHVPAFTNKEIRLLFLGYPVTKNEQTYEPLINASDSTIYNQFLQKVMFMTRSRYERQLVSRVFQQGGRQPKEFKKHRELLSYLQSKPNSVSFVMPKTVSRLNDIQVVQELW